MRRNWKQLGAFFLSVVLALETPFSVCAAGSVSKNDTAVEVNEVQAADAAVYEPEADREESNAAGTTKKEEEKEKTAPYKNESTKTENGQETGEKELVEADETLPEAEAASPTVTVSVNGLVYELTEIDEGSYAASVTPWDEEDISATVSANNGVLKIASQITDEGTTYTITKITSVFYDAQVKEIQFADGITAITPSFLTDKQGYGNQPDFTVAFPDSLEDVSTGFLVTKRRGSGLSDSGKGEDDSIAFIPKWLEAQAGNGAVYAGKVLLYVPDNGTETIAVKAGCVSIAEAAFMNNVTVKNVTIPATVTSLGEEIFAGCSGLSGVTFQEGISIGKISYRMFYKSGMTSVSIPASVVDIGTAAFRGCENLQSVAFANISKVETIEYRAFSDCTKLDKFVLPDSVKSIGTACFDGCTSLSTFTISEDSSLEKIEYQAFGWTPWKKSTTGAPITTIYIPGKALSYSEGSAGDCTGLFAESDALTSVTIGSTESVADSRIYFAMFQNCTKLKTVEVKNSVCCIGIRAFEGCTALEQVTFTDADKSDLNTISYRAFADCTKLDSFVLPDSVKSIGTACFDGCTSLSTFTISEDSSLEKIEYQAFGWKTYTVVNPQERGFLVYVSGSQKSTTGAPITEIYLPATALSYSGAPALFAGNDALESVKIGKTSGTSSTWIPFETFMDCTSLKTVELQGSVYGIATAAFAGDTSLEAINLQGVKRIDSYAFPESGLKEVVIPAGMDCVGHAAFAHCKKLKTMTFQSDLNCNNEGRNLPSVLGIVDGNLHSYNDSGFSQPGKTVRSAADYARLYPKETCLTKVVVELESGKSVLNINNYGAGFLAQVPSLEEVVLPENITTIPKYSFQFCSSLKTIQLPASLEVIGECAFQFVPGIDVDFTKLTNLKTIGSQAFMICGVDGESSCNSMYTDSIENGGISNIILPDGIETVQTAAFFGQRNVEKIVLPDSLTVIGYNAFKFTNSVKEIDIQASASAFDSVMSEFFLNEIFWNSNFNSKESPLEKITLGEDFLSEGGTFPEGLFQQKNMTTVDMQSVSANSISPYMFNGARRLSALQIPQSVEKIERGAFIDTVSLKTLTLPEKVAVLEVENLKGSGLTQLYVYNPDMIFKEPVDASVSANGFDSKTMTRISSAYLFGSKELGAYEDYVPVPADVVIFGYENSTAQAYALKNGNQFRVLGVYKVTFESNGGTEIATVDVKGGLPVTKPADPVKEGFTFAGWYKDAAFDSPYDFNQAVDSDIVLYAKWVKPSAEPGTDSGSKPGTDSGNKPSSDSGSASQTGGENNSEQTKADYEQSNVPVLKLNVTSLKMKKGTSCSGITATEILPGDKIVKYVSSNKKVVSVTKKGKLTAKKVGKATITVKTKQGATAKIKVTVQKKTVKTKKLTVTNVKNKKLTLKKGKSFTLKTKLTPISSSQKLTYESSDEKIAKVTKKGKIKAKKKGTATITVKSGSKKVKIEVTIK